MRAWHEVTAVESTNNQSHQILCPILLGEEKGGTWKNLSIVLGRRFGWNSSANTISVLDPFSIPTYRIGEDPEDFALLFEKEADVAERLMLAKSQALLKQATSLPQLSSFATLSMARILRKDAYALFAKRVVRDIGLLHTMVFVEPNPNRHLVSITTRRLRVLEEGVDKGVLVLKDGALPMSQIRVSPTELL